MKSFERKTKAVYNSMEFSHGLRRALVMGMALVYFVWLGFDVFYVTTLLAAASIVSMFLEFPTGAVADYDSRKKSLMISFLLFSVAFFGIFFSSAFWLIAVFWFLSEIAWTFSTGAGSAWVTDALGIGKKKKEIVKLKSNGYFSEKIGHFIGGLIGLIIIAINFRLIWLVAGLVNLVLFFILWFFAEERNFEPERIPHGYLKKSLIKAKESYVYLFSRKGKALRKLMTISFLITIVIGGFWVALPLMFTESLGLNPEYLSGIYSVLAVLALIGPFFASKIKEKEHFMLELFLLFLIMGVMMVLIGFSNSIYLSILIFAFYQIFAAANEVIEDSAWEFEFDSKIRASLGSIGSINWNIANSLGVFLAGISIGLFGISLTLIGCGILLGVFAFLYLFF